jgi:hypothetical protein
MTIHDSSVIKTAGPKGETTIVTPTVDPFTEVPVAAGVLTSTAQLLEQLAEFFDTNPAARKQLGYYMAVRNADAEDPSTEGVLTVCQLTDAAELLSALAGEEVKQQ